MPLSVDPPHSLGMSSLCYLSTGRLWASLPSPFLSPYHGPFWSSTSSISTPVWSYLLPVWKEAQPTSHHMKQKKQDLSTSWVTELTEVDLPFEGLGFSFTIHLSNFPFKGTLSTYEQYRR
ncbi:unnamed protein product [Linum trigynum]|uniref:Uncharacterized protein n=1 Tax=Linum trigynum TaxID=586398 RepID=A0AAV2DED6_9ROSI